MTDNDIEKKIAEKLGIKNDRPSFTVDDLLEKAAEEAKQALKENNKDGDAARD